MSRTRAWTWFFVTLAGLSGAGFLDLRRGESLVDPAAVSGMAPDTCFDCKDMRCDECPPPRGCREILGHCYETVRNVSQYCVPRQGGQWENCKWRVDPAGSCVTQLLNPCTPENVLCTTPNAKCGPLGICIPEGVCTHP